MDQIRSIVVATDFSPLSQAAAIRASTLAQLDGAAIHLVHAVRFPVIATPYEVSLPPSVWDSVRNAAEQRLEELRKATAAKTQQTVSAEISDSSDPVQAIAAAVQAHAADLVVMGTHGHSGIKHAFLGSVAERTLRTVDRPVLAVKEDPTRAALPIARILVAVDFSVHSDRAVEVAAGLGTRLGASVDVVHALMLPRDYMPYVSQLGTELEEKVQTATAERLEDVRQRLEKDRLRVALHSRRGSPPLVIAEVAEKIDCQLIVMGTRGNTGLAHVLLGSVAERTLRVAPCSVLAVHTGETQADA